MSEVRQDPISGHRVILAPDRHNRPAAYDGQEPLSENKTCPFCAGHEELTSNPICWYPPGTQEAYLRNWRVRVIANKFPALSTATTSLNSQTATTGDHEGIHEVFVESRRHIDSFGELSSDEAAWTWLAYRERLLAIRQQKQWAYAQIFKNSRRGSGASIEHSHSQLLASRFVPSALSTELRSAAEHHHRNKTCLYCSMIESEIAGNQRVVMKDKDLVAFCPAASRFPYEVWLFPITHLPRFEASTTSLLERASRILQRLIRSFDRELRCPPYNYFLHTAPFDSPQQAYFHWHLEIFPRLVTTGGYEWATNSFVNTVPPETAARHLRQRWQQVDAHQ